MSITEVRNFGSFISRCVFVLLQKVSVPDISSLPAPLTESDAKQINVRQSCRYC